MATNVTEKDKTLNEIIDWCDAERESIKERPDADMHSTIWDMGMIEALASVSKHCRSLLGYSGSMPSEVPNQSDDANVRAVSR